MGSLYNSRYFFFALFPSPFFGGPFPLLFIRSSFTFLLLSSGSSNSRSSFLIRSGYHEVSVGPISALFKSLRPVGRLVSLSAVWNIRAAARAIFRADAAPPPGVVAIASSSSSPLFFFFFFFFCKKEGRQRDGDFFLCRQREQKAKEREVFFPERKGKERKGKEGESDGFLFCFCLFVGRFFPLVFLYFSSRKQHTRTRESEKKKKKSSDLEENEGKRKTSTSSWRTKKKRKKTKANTST